jgi:hypothetical protein
MIASLLASGRLDDFPKLDLRKLRYAEEAQESEDPFAMTPETIPEVKEVRNCLSSLHLVRGARGIACAAVF